MWSDIGAVVLFVAIIVGLPVMGATMYRAQISWRKTQAGDHDLEEVMFREDYHRRQNLAAGRPVTPRWWQRPLRRRA